MISKTVSEILIFCLVNLNSKNKLKTYFPEKWEGVNDDKEYSTLDKNAI